MYKILAIDGGVIRGIISAMVVAEIEKRTGKPIAEVFDMVAGTSSGGIIALGLTKPDGNGKPAYRAEQLVEVFRDRGKDIFSPALIPFLRWLKNWFLPKHSTKGLEKLLAEYFGEVTLKEALTEVLIASYATEKPEEGPGAHFFSRKKARENAARNFKMRDVARATSAGPTFFPPKKMELAGDPSKWYTLVDGGVVATNPAMCAFAAALDAGQRADDILLVSVGAGYHLHSHPYGTAKWWGRLQWVRPILNILIGGVGETVDFHIRRVLPEGQYYRFQAPLHGETSDHPDLPSTDFDNVKQENIQAMMKLTREKILEPQKDELRELCEKLTA